MRHGLIVSATLILVIVLLSACTPQPTDGVEATALPAATSASLPVATSTSLPAAAAATSHAAANGRAHCGACRSGCGSY